MTPRFSLVLSFAVTLLLASGAGAAVIVVDNDGDDLAADCNAVGMCTLRAAVAAAEALVGADQIELTEGATYSLTQPAQLFVSTTITVRLALDERSPFTTAIDAQGNHRAFGVSGGTLTVRGVTIRNGDVASDGGGIRVDTSGSLTLEDVVLTGNQAPGGGGLYVAAGSTAVLTRVVVSGNVADTASADGGGILNDGMLTLTDVNVAGNHGTVGEGGGIANRTTGTLAMTRGAVVRHTASGDGGGIYNLGGTLTLTGTSVGSNRVGGAGTTQQGGGIWTTGPLTLNGARIVGNTSEDGGGGIWAEGSPAIDINADAAGIGTVIAQNVATAGRGGGLRFATSVVTVDDSTISSNVANSVDGFTGAGVSVAGAGTLTLSNTIVRENVGNERGGGILGVGAAINVIARSRILDNSSLGDASLSDGGGLYVSGGTLLVQESVISGNVSASEGGGGLLIGGADGDVIDTTVSGNEALRSGGLSVISAGTTLDLLRVTVSGNTASAINGGGGMTVGASASATASHTTFSGNVADAGPGGAIEADSTPTVVLTNVTFANNTAPAGQAQTLDNVAGGSWDVRNTIFARVPGSTRPNCTTATLTSASGSDFNWFEQTDVSCGFNGAGNVPGTITPIDDLDLQPLAYNGGPFGLETHALGAGSDAIDMAEDTNGGLGPDCVGDLDNRSAPRGSPCDIGAHEQGAVPPNPSETLGVAGQAQGGRVEITVLGVTLGIDTTTQTASQVVALLAVAINADAVLDALRVKAVAVGTSLQTTDPLNSFLSTDPGLVLAFAMAPIPVLPGVGVGVLLASLLVVGGARLRRPRDLVP